MADAVDNLPIYDVAVNSDIYVLLFEDLYLKDFPESYDVE